MTILAHLSDPHFGTVDDAVHDALLRDLHAHHLDLMLLTGDITQRARTGQFRAARAFLEQLPRVPALTIPGNHDIPLFDIVTRLVAPYRLFRRHIGGDLAPHYSDANLALICVDATRRMRHKHGVIGERQIQRTALTLRGLDQPFKLIATHQPLAVTRPRDLHNVARGARRALTGLIDAGADLFLGGHIHLPYTMSVASRGGVPRTAVLMQAGTAISRRIRHGVPNSYNRITLQVIDGVRSMALERRDYDDATHAFSTRTSHLASHHDGSWNLSEAHA